MEVVKRFIVDCGICEYGIFADDDIITDSLSRKCHSRCVDDVQDGHLVEWRNAESVSRADELERELARVAPLAKQGKCPVCFLELPATGICDDHGRAV